MTPPRYVLIANPGTKRCEAYRQAVIDYWARHGHVADLEVVQWAVIAAADGDLDHLPAFDRPAVVRLESPGKDAHAFRRVLAAGARAAPAEPPQDWETLELPAGILYRPGLWYRGFRRVLEGLKRSLEARPYLRPTACPLAVAHMFDKNRTLATLSDAGVPVPEWTTPDLPAVRGCGWPVVYVKLNTGASATGIVVVRFDGGGEPHGLTTLLEHEGAFFNTRQLCKVRGDGLTRCLEFLITEGATVQRGLPHAQLDGQNADVRVVCVYGRPVATIFRLSSHPITNLHLGGRRGDLARCRAAIPPRAWLDALDACAAAAGCFDAAVAGVDLLFEPGWRRHHVLEVNAFGDFFPGWTTAGGQSLHEAEIAATAARTG
jgi:hypothetical protein